MHDLCTHLNLYTIIYPYRCKLIHSYQCHFSQRMVTVHSAQLGPNEDRSQYLLSNWNTMFPSLLARRQLGPLLQFGTAFVMAINQEDTTTYVPLETRIRVYSAVLDAIQDNNDNIATLGDAQQVAFLLAVLTVSGKAQVLCTFCMRFSGYSRMTGPYIVFGNRLLENCWPLFVSGAAAPSNL